MRSTMKMLLAAVLLVFQIASVRADENVRMIGWVSDGHCTV